MSHSERQTIGKYRVLSQLGEGAMGVVHAGHDPVLDRPVAIKTLHPHLVAGEHGDDFLKRFRREARAAASCQHPNIVSVWDFGEHQGVPYMVMEFVQGRSLETWLQLNDSLGLKRCIQIVGQLLKALNAAHSKGVVHRDIKPGNILVRPDGNIKLTDFGIARVAARPELTQAGMVVGTPRYMAPEQSMGLSVDHRADLFAVALILFELLTLAELPLDVPRARLPRIRNLPPNTRIDYEVAVPAAFVPVLTRGLAAFAGERFASAREFADALRGALGDLKSAVGELADAPADAPTLVKPALRRRLDGRGTDADLVSDLTSLVSFATGSDPAQAGIVSQLDEQSLLELRESLSHHLGPSAGELLRQKLADAISFAELIHSLAAAIGSRRQRRRFLARWAPE